jgi:DNA-binding beta-propeller fold protein YncE
MFLSAATAHAGVTQTGLIGTDGQVYETRGLAVSSDGSIYVTDHELNRIAKFALSGAFEGHIGATGPGQNGAGSDPGQFKNPADVVFDPDGFMYVADSENDRIQKFDGDGNFVLQWPVSVWPQCLELDSDGNLLVLVWSSKVEGDADRIQKFDTDTGAQLDEWGTTGSGEGQIGEGPLADCLATSGTGDVYVADSRNHRVLQFEEDGDFVDAWGLADPGPAGFGSGPLGIEMHGDGELLVGDAGDVRRVRRFTLDGGLISTYPGMDGNGLAVHGATVVASMRHRVDIIDPRPTAAMTVTPNPAYSSTDVVLDATASFVELGTIERFEWDLDGDGAFELDTGANGVVSRALPVADRAVSVRATGSRGEDPTAVATQIAMIRLQPPPGLPGVSINGGAQFTNTPQVTLDLRWPSFAAQLFASNDGGFGTASPFLVAPQVLWTLDSSGAERLPKTVYVRFTGGAAGPETYQDDIILDQTPPEIESATFEEERAAGAGRARSAQARRYRVSIAASDTVSGVAQMQLSSDRSAGVAWLPYARATTFTGRRPIFVRVRDFAGNASPWTPVAGGLARAAALSSLRAALADARRRLGRSSPRALARRRSLRHRLSWPGAGTAAFHWVRAGAARKLTLAKGQRTRDAAGAAGVRVRPTRAGRRALRRARRMRVTIVGVFRADDLQATARMTFTLRR